MTKKNPKNLTKVSVFLPMISTAKFLAYKNTILMSTFLEKPQSIIVRDVTSGECSAV